MFLYFCVIVFYFYLFSGFSNSTQEDTKCLLPKPSTIICDLWGLFEHTWMWDYSEFWPSESEFLVVGLELAGGGCSWTESGNRQIHSGLDSAEIKYINQLQILLMLGLQCNIYLNLLNIFRYLPFTLHPNDSGQQNTGMHFNGNEASGKMEINWVKNSSQQFGNLIYGKLKSYYNNVASSNF